MPYKYGHYFVGFVLVVILTGFWASYFAPIREVPLAFHVHAFTATSWLLLLIAQSVAIHRRANALHRIMGKASFALFPLLILGFTMIINVSAGRYAAREGDFIAFVGPAFGIGMAVAIAAYLVLFHGALKHRRNVRLHAGYMLATPLILFESPFSRLMDAAFPWMNVIGSAGPRGLLDTIVVSDTLAIVFALGLYAMDRRHGAPWLIAAAFMALQAALMWFAPDIAAFGPMFDAYARIPDPVTLLAALAVGAATGWLGWQAGRAPARKPVAAAA
jgi:hypothetical protein